MPLLCRPLPSLLAPSSAATEAELFAESAAADGAIDAELLPSDPAFPELAAGAAGAAGRRPYHRAPPKTHTAPIQCAMVNVLLKMTMESMRDMNLRTCRGKGEQATGVEAEEN